MSVSSRSLRQPAYRLHKPTGQAVVIVSGRDFFLGRHGTAKSSFSTGIDREQIDVASLSINRATSIVRRR